MRVLVIGPNGQDGTLIRSRLNGVENHVFGLTRNKVIDYTLKFVIQEQETADFKSKDLLKILSKIKPHVIFHVGAVHGSSQSMESEIAKQKKEMFKLYVEYTNSILEWQSDNIHTKSLFALSSQMYSNNNTNKIINEISSFSPQNYYGETKAMALDLIRKFRLRDKVNTAGLILFNHSSEFNNEKFLFPRLAKQLYFISKDKRESVKLINPLASIDMSSAYEFVDAILKIMNLDKLNDFVLSQGISFEIEYIVRRSCEILNLENIRIQSSEKSKFIDCLVGDISKAKKELDWSPVKKPWEVLSDMTRKLLGFNP